MGLRLSLVACWCEMQVEGGVTAAKGFKAAGIYGGLRAKGEKPDLALVACDVDATVAGTCATLYELLRSLVWQRWEDVLVVSECQCAALVR